METQYQRQLGVFAKYWKPGRVKTRLAKTEGDVRAAELYRIFLQATLRRFSDCDCRRLLVYTPVERRDEFERLANDNWELEPQAVGDLGERMQQYFRASFNLGSTKVLLVGSDSPTLPRSRIDAAFQLLDDCEVVLGPTEDGGYYLIGSTREIPEMFDGIAWSTPQVWSQTVERLRAASVRFRALDVWYDVDDRASLDRLRDELEKSANDAFLGELKGQLESQRTACD